MHLHELMGWPGPMTARQYDAWQAWLDLEWNRPNRADHYAMQVAMYVLAANSKNSDAILQAGASGMRIPFGLVQPAKSLTPEEQATKDDAEKRARRAGHNVETRTMTRSELAEMAAEQERARQESRKGK